MKLETPRDRLDSAATLDSLMRAIAVAAGAEARAAADGDLAPQAAASTRIGGRTSRFAGALDQSGALSAVRGSDSALQAARALQFQAVQTLPCTAQRVECSDRSESSAGVTDQRIARRWAWFGTHCSSETFGKRVCGRMLDSTPCRPEQQSNERPEMSESTRARALRQRQTFLTSAAPRAAASVPSVPKMVAMSGRGSAKMPTGLRDEFSPAGEEAAASSASIRVFFRIDERLRLLAVRHD